MTKKQKIILFVIVVLAIFFRYYKIIEMPGGLFPDEAANGLDINSMQQGQLQPFYERGNGREALFFYMLWGAVEIFGKGAWQHHIVSALVGVISVILCFLFTRRLFLLDRNPEPVEAAPLSQVFSSNILPAAQEVQNARRTFLPAPAWEQVVKATNIALLASFLMAVSTWHVVLSRTAFRANLIPLFATLAFYLSLCSYQAQKLKTQLWLAFFSGAAFALGFYTYIAYRILVPIVIILIAWPVMGYLKEQGFLKGLKEFVQKYWAHKTWFLIGFVIFIYPLAKYFWTHEGSFLGRSGQVSVFNPELNQGNLIGAIVEVFRLSILGFFTQGDLNWRHNISGFPFLSPLVSPFFGVALIMITFFAAWYFFAPRLKPQFWKYFLLAGWFWGMLVPVVTTAEGIPHGLRSIGTIPAVFIMSAWGLYYAAHYVRKVHNYVYNNWRGLDCWQYRVTTKALALVVFIYFGSLVLQTHLLYFGYAYNSPENFYAFRSDLTPVSDYLKQYGDKKNTYLVLDTFSVQTVEYLTSVDAANPENPANQPYKQVDPEDSWKLQGLKKGDQIIFTQSSIFDIKKFKQYHPQAMLALEVRNKFRQTVMAVYKVR